MSNVQRGWLRAPRIGLAVILAMALLPPIAVSAADPPPNDRFEQAQPLETLPQTFAAIDIASATWEPGERWPCAPAGSTAKTVWFTFTYDDVRNGYVQVAAPGATVTAFYLPSGSTIEDLSPGYCKGTSTLVIPWYANRTEYVQVAADGSGSPISVTFTWLPAPDDLAQAEPVVLGPDTLEATTIAYTRLATIERRVGDPTMPAAYDIPWCGWSSVTFARSVWYSFAPDRAGMLTVDPTDSDFSDVTLTAFGGIPTQSWVPRMGCASARQPLTFQVWPGFVYYVQAVEAAAGRGTPLSGGGTLRLSWSLDEPPALTVPEKVTVEATGPTGAVVTYDASAVDDVDGRIPADCDWPTGATFPIATTTVRCHATDTAQNVVYGSFQVTVSDTVAPAVSYGTHPDVYTVADAVHIACAASDAVGVTASTCADVDGFGWTFGLGLHTYGATATDAAGNQGSASTEFTVVATYGSMSDLTRQWLSKAGVVKDLVALLDSAAAAEERGQLQAEAGKLADYRSLVLAQAGKSITAARAAMLVAFSYGL